MLFLVPLQDVVPEQAPRDGPHEAVRILGERFPAFGFLLSRLMGSRSDLVLLSGLLGLQDDE